ncbi:dehydrogenase/reductase SDR family member 13-like [Hypomesus transpacificus]|uniref:dehydrogenase/reductase SDR family member 13-like n=1 Tax=Hypomesus transpacificus TaxID=137520 RepID=UPI001F077354|nr:dehydrogenase/reductase SDR family member 13-like [Hypomesus transpacificus]
METFCLITVVLVCVYAIVYNIGVKGASCKSKVKLHGKTAIVTGSNTGIGKTTAIDLAKRGARVILACRSKQRGDAALAEIKKESGSNQVVFMQLDLGSLKSVRSFVETFLKTEPRVDLLINNAGIYMQGKTEDGLGMMFGVNHIGHFLLTILLLDRLKECGPSRVVNVSSTFHNFGTIDFNCLSIHKELGVGNTTIDDTKIYSNSKLCNVLFTHELAKRLKGTKVTCYSLHPGSINTDLTRDAKILAMLLKPITMLFFKTPVQGSQTTLHCALQEGLEPLSGRYFSNCTVRDVYAKAKDDAVAKKLWEVSETLCGLS